MQVASLGLVKAIDRFEPGRGAFSSFAVPTILGELKRHFRDRSWIVRPPRALQERTALLDKHAHALWARTGRAPTPEELAEATGLDVDEVLDGLTAAEAYRSESLEAPRGGDDDAPTLAERLGRTDSGFADAENRADTETWLAILDERDRQILHMRFAQDMTQSEIGAVIGISQMQVSRIVRRSLDRLRPLAREDGGRLPEVA